MDGDGPEGDGGDGDGGGGSPATQPEETDTATGTGDGGATQSTTETPTPGPSAASTGVSGTVVSESADDLAFVWHRHYEMNGVEGVHGLLENEGDVAYAAVTVTAVPSADGGAELGEFSEVATDGLPPGERAQFQFGFDDVEDVAEYEISATGRRDE